MSSNFSDLYQAFCSNHFPNPSLRDSTKHNNNSHKAELASNRLVMVATTRVDSNRDGPRKLGRNKAELSEGKDAKREVGGI